MPSMESTYELIDAGDGRRLERFGTLRVDRPAPGASERRRAPALWPGAVTFRGGRGWADVNGGPPPTGEFAVGTAGVTMLVSLATGGQVGLFPEHAASAKWVREAVGRRLAKGAAPTVLNLFAYTGLLTLVAAEAGAAVTHVDASRPAAAWARRNAAANGLDGHPVRWIVDDAAAFIRREARRGRTYDGVILDPPSYGHGGGRGHAPAFELGRDIEALLRDARAVAAPGAFWLLSTHTEGWDVGRLVATLGAALEVRPAAITGLPLELAATSGAHLRLGAAARFDRLAGQPR